MRPPFISPSNSLRSAIAYPFCPRSTSPFPHGYYVAWLAVRLKKKVEPCWIILNKLKIKCLLNINYIECPWPTKLSYLSSAVSRISRIKTSLSPPTLRWPLPSMTNFPTSLSGGSLPAPSRNSNKKRIESRKEVTLRERIFNRFPFKIRGSAWSYLRNKKTSITRSQTQPIKWKCPLDIMTPMKLHSIRCISLMSFNTAKKYSNLISNLIKLMRK
jgi:hypothetical protein